MPQIGSPFPQFFDRAGSPISGGELYVGEVSENPVTSPITVYWDEACTQPASQPIDIQSGYAVRNANFARVYTTEEDFSASLYDSNAALVYYTASNTSIATLRDDLAASSGSSLVGFIQAGAGAVARTAQSKMRDRVDARDFGVVAGNGLDQTDEVQAAINYATLIDVECNFPSGNIIISETITAGCSITGQGSPQDGTATVFVWQGSAAYVLEFGAYKQGWNFRDFRIDMSGVTTDTVAMYFNDGLTWGSFSNLCFKGRHTGSSWGGTYANHDGITIEGGANMSECTFRRIVFFRNRNGLTVTDPHNRGDGNNSIMESCYAFVDGWAVNMCGPNNTFTMFESNVESGNHSFVLSGQYAADWVFVGCNFSTAASASGNQIIYADTSGGVNIATVIGGTLEQANGGGFPNLVRDAGPTGGKIFRFMACGMNNYNSTAISVDNFDLGQSTARSNQFFYGESRGGGVGVFAPWQPTFTGLTIVLGAGSVTYGGRFTLIGNMCFWTAQISPSGGATVESVAATTRINNLPFFQTLVPCTCAVSNAGTLASYGAGQGAIGGKNMFMPVWPAVANGITMSGFYFTDGST